jgi:hypothetical protein
MGRTTLTLDWNPYMHHLAWSYLDLRQHPIGGEGWEDERLWNVLGVWRTRISCDDRPESVAIDYPGHAGDVGRGLATPRAREAHRRLSPGDRY